MREMGIETLLRDDQKGPIIQTFLTPRDPNFRFETFYEQLRQRGYGIYPGKLTKRPSFRIGTIGQIDETVIRGALAAIREIFKETNVTEMRPLEARETDSKRRAKFMIQNRKAVSVIGRTYAWPQAPLVV